MFGRESELAVLAASPPVPPAAGRPLVAWARLAAFVLIAMAPGVPAAAGDPAAGRRHAIAMHGEPALKQGQVPAYVDPRAPKGGRLVRAVLGAFDSLNPFIVKGLPAELLRGTVYESLMARGYDEPFSLYGLIARTVETDQARSFVAFRLDPAARFSDGRPVTAEDVVFSWQLLRDKGRPNLRTYYGKVTRAEIVGGDTVRFDLSQARDRELPLILALMPILPRHAVDPETFEQTTLAPPVGSGPYVVAEVKPGDSVTFRRNPDYWGRDLTVSRGLWNFDEIRVDYYRDGNTFFEAFKRGLIDLRVETDPSRWQTGYDVPAVRDGRIVKEAVASGYPKPMTAFVFNTRRPLFADVRVREALALLIDFDWINRNFLHGLGERTASFFEGSDLSARGRPASARERELLAPFPGAVRADVMDGSWTPGSGDGSGRDRTALRRALKLLADAGWTLDQQTLRARSGEPFVFEILVVTREQERLALAYQRDLARAGIMARVRVVDAVQFDRRRQTYDYDMIQNIWDNSLSPGNEQSFYWGAAAADAPGTRNYMGVKSPAIDAMIAGLLAAEGRDDFVAAVRALDRVLMSGVYVVPLYHVPAQWVARWNHVARPEATSLFGALPETWWHRPATATPRGPAHDPR